LEFVRSDRFGGFLISMVIGVTGIALSLAAWVAAGAGAAIGHAADQIGFGDLSSNSSAAFR
jgi:hypothetical protein